MTWRPLFEANASRDDCLRRVIMSGYTRDSGLLPHVGEAFYGNPDARGSRWIWAGGGEVIEPLGFQDLPDFPIPAKNDKYACGGPTRIVETAREE
jgi:hypothetical protein